MGVKGYYVTVADLLSSASFKEAKNSDDFGRKFRDVFANIGLEDEMINWYASKREDTLSGKRRGAYIFGGGDVKAVSDNLNQLFKFSKTIKKSGTCENIYEIIGILQELLPWIKDEKEMEMLTDGRTREIRRLFSLIDQIRRLKIFNEIEQKQDRIGKELETVWKYIGKIESSRATLLQDSIEKEEFNVYLERQKKIERAVIEACLKKMNAWYLQETFGTKKHKNFYEKLYAKVGRWYTKWVYLLHTIDDLHEIENFYNICELFWHCGKDYEYGRAYFREEEALDEKMQAAYDSFQKLSIHSFSKYFEASYDDEKLIKMAKKFISDEMPEWKKDKKNADVYRHGCYEFVDQIGKLYYKKHIDVIYMEAALYELNQIIKLLQDGGNDLISERVPKNSLERGGKEFSEKFAEYFKYCTGKEMGEECRDCIFYLKYNNKRKKTILEYIPQGRLNLEWDKLWEEVRDR